MKRALVGIIAILCLQVMFMAYNSMERRVDGAFNADLISDPLSGATTAPSALSDEHFLIGGTAAPTSEAAVADHRSNAPVPRTPLRVSPKPALIRNSEIAYSRPSRRHPVERPGNRAYTASPSTFDVAIKSQNLPEKKSFIGKALPIVKKPYSWLKSLAGKLN